ncbi:hypothetical protein [Clostridium magnum]|uniref:Uncharacterized protein n=1 Tax=Clostridium magnum DSM 2767 TaxID=1121326 RepID=A0A162UIZ5_9CLOT|nr:hypothetical protein [Clostridium magnum]KZL93967.1 hypothetical protein CLMAG_10200 [Clostridium magnum DSM 2767]SHH99511.1 hypothetical protein SAMN02745944_02044 [Clostridium magnum DSM 2767]
MNKKYVKMFQKAKQLVNVSSSTIQLFNFLEANPSTYSIGVSTNCTIYKFGIPVCYIYFKTRSIEAWDEDQSGNECTKFNDLISKFTTTPNLRLVSKPNGVPIQKASLYTDADVLDLLNAIQIL